MIVLKVENIKEFMAKVLTGDMFDKFHVACECEVNTFSWIIKGIRGFFCDFFLILQLNSTSGGCLKPVLGEDRGSEGNSVRERGVLTRRPRTLIQSGTGVPDRGGSGS